MGDFFKNSTHSKPLQIRKRRWNALVRENCTKHGKLITGPQVERVEVFVANHVQLLGLERLELNKLWNNITCSCFRWRSSPFAVTMRWATGGGSLKRCPGLRAAQFLKPLLD